MKNNLIKLYATVFFFCVTVATFAQLGDNNDDGNLEIEDAQAPIDDYVLLFAIVGIALVFLKYRSIAKQKSLQN